MDMFFKKTFIFFNIVIFSFVFLFSSTPLTYAIVDDCSQYEATKKIYDQLIPEQKNDPVKKKELSDLQTACAESQSQSDNQSKSPTGTKTNTVDERLINPLGITTVQEFSGRLIKFAFGLAGSAALLMFVWGGLQYILSAGNDDKIKKGKETIKYAAFGLIVMFVSYTLINALIVALQSGTVT